MKKKLCVLLTLLMVVAFVAACGEKEEKEYYYSPGDAFVTNIQESVKLIKIVLTLGTSADEPELLLEKNAVIRNCILEVLRSQPAIVLEAADAQTVLSDIIVTRLNELFPVSEGAALFRKVYFDEFVIQ